MDAQGPVPEATMTRIERLPRLARTWVLEAREDLDLEVIFTGLPEDRAGQIRVLADCDRGWDRGPGDWDWLVLLTYRDTERPFREGDAIAVIEGHPYQVYILNAEEGDFFTVHPTSIDGCTYAISSPADPEGLDSFLGFLASLELGRAGGTLDPAPGDPPIPPGWETVSGVAFDAAVARDWLYNLTGAPLTDEQRASIAALPPHAAADVQHEQETLDGLEIIYLGLPEEADSIVTVLTFCDLSFNRTPDEWAEEMRGRRADQGSGMSPLGLVVTVDGRPHEVYLGESPERQHFDVYVVAHGCHYLFAVTPHDSGLPGLVDFVRFLQTVELRGG